MKRQRNHRDDARPTPLVEALEERRMLAAVSITASNRTASESGTTALLHVRRSTASWLKTRVYFNVSGTASLSDYSANVNFILPPAGTFFAGGPIPPLQAYVDIPAFRTSTDVTVRATDDSALEGRETAVFTIAPSSSYQITPLSGSETVFIIDTDSVHINFQTPGTAPAGYKADTGGIFGARNGLSYGWDADNSANMRIRNSAGSPDARYDTHAKMQEGGDRKWEIAVPNGVYIVRLVAGEPDNVDSVYRMNLEGTLALSGTPSGDTRWFRSTIAVQVSDGRLTLTNAAGASNNKIAFIDIKSANGGPAGPVATNLPVRLYSAATASQWHQEPSGLFSDNQIDEAIWL